MKKGINNGRTNNSFSNYFSISGFFNLPFDKREATASLKHKKWRNKKGVSRHVIKKGVRHSFVLFLSKFMFIIYYWKVYARRI